MKTKFTLAIALLVVPFLFCQNITSKKINSSELSDERTLKIYIPPSYEEDENKLYPITIVLDAEYLFDVYVANATLYAKNDRAPEQIIIGINQNQNEERYADCSYLKENSLPTEKGESFYRFVRGELIDYIEENYRVSPFRTIVGNTITANFINYFLVEDTPGFNAFININPYYAIDMPSMLDAKVNTIKNEAIYYFACNGNYLPKKRIEPITTVYSLLSKITNAKFKFKYQSFKNSDKITSIGQAIPSALQFIFELYSPISKQEFEKNIKKLSPPDAIAYLENKYTEIDYLFGNNLKIRERDIFAIESIILDKENGDYLKDFGEMINKMYKESPIGDYYIGRYYETGQKLNKALKYYKSGYMKLPEDDPNSDGYYENIERILKKQDGTYQAPKKN